MGLLNEQAKRRRQAGLLNDQMTHNATQSPYQQFAQAYPQLDQYGRKVVSGGFLQENANNFNEAATNMRLQAEGKPPLSDKNMLDYFGAGVMTKMGKASGLLNDIPEGLKRQSGDGHVFDKDTIRLYRGLTQKYDKSYNKSMMDSPNDYTTFTDNIDLAREYAGKDGYVYGIDMPRNQMVNEYIDESGERGLFFNNKKPAGLNNVTGDEYLIYNDHELYNPDALKLVK